MPRAGVLLVSDPAKGPAAGTGGSRRTYSGRPSCAVSLSDCGLSGVLSRGTAARLSPFRARCRRPYPGTFPDSDVFEISFFCCLGGVPGVGLLCSAPGEGTISNAEVPLPRTSSLPGFRIPVEGKKILVYRNRCFRLSERQRKPKGKSVLFSVHLRGCRGAETPAPERTCFVYFTPNSSLP